MLGNAVVAITIALALAAPKAVNAEVVSLFIPDTQPVALSADFVGTDAAGHTTWRFGAGTASGTLSPPTVALPSATMVVSPTDIHVVADVPDLGATLHDDCTVKDGVAVCTVVMSSAGGATTMGETTQTMSARAFEVQVTAVPPGYSAAPSPTPTSGASTVSGPAPLANGAGGGAALGSGRIASPSPMSTGGSSSGSGSANGAAGLRMGSMLATGLGVVVVLTSCLL